MPDSVRRLTYVAFLAFSLVLSACGITDLKDDLETAREEYGYLKGRASGPGGDADILFALVTGEGDDATVTTTRAVALDEEFFVLVPTGAYTLIAFSDSSGDFAYQPGEPAAQIENPAINWFRDMEGQERVDYDGLTIQEIELSSATVLDQGFDLSLSSLRANSKAAKNFLRIVTWDDEAFSAENTELGMWQPGLFERQVGYGLYVLEEFDPTKKTIVFVHGISDTPVRFQSIVETMPDDYQAVLLHYPSSFPLEYTSYVLKEALDEMIRRYQLTSVDVIAHSMGGLVSKGMIYQADETLREKMSVFVTMSSPFGGHSAAAAGIKWAPVVAPVWWAMAPGSSYLAYIDSLDLTDGPDHHLVYTYSHELGGEREEDDGVVSVESQLAESAQSNAVAMYGVADNHTGVAANPCVTGLIGNILNGDTDDAVPPDCQFE
jgi:pimeloyl-ACP methyl ester carboxylesterase